MNQVTVKDGNVGIGTTSPVEALDVNGQVKAGNLTLGNWPSDPDNYVFFGANTFDQTTGQNYALLQGGNENGDIATYLNSPEEIRFRIANVDKMVLNNNGSVGIGTTAPIFSLHVKGDGWVNSGIESTTYGAALSLQNQDRRFDIASRGNGLEIRDITAGDQLRVQLDSDGKLTVYGTLHVTGADLAEPFDMTDIDNLEMGDVVVIDPQNPLHVTKSTQAYSTLVAGIVSSNEQAGYIAGGRSDGSSDKPIALVGRVLCKVSTENGSIQVGDLLTTSNTPGHAMKATDVLKQQGAILGKALQAFDGEQGQIMVLVTLQ